MTPVPRAISWCVQALMLALIAILGQILWAGDFPSLILPATGLAIYLLAFWVFFPEFRGREASHRALFARRWAKFAAVVGIPLAAFWAMPLIACFVFPLRAHFPFVRSFGIAVVLAYLPIQYLAAAQAYVCAHASTEYPGAEDKRGFVNRVARILLRFHRLTPPTFALAVGCFLVMASLVLSMHWNVPSFFGYQVVLGTVEWPNDSPRWAEGSWVYRLGVSLALLTLILLFARRRKTSGTWRNLELALAIAAYFLFQNILSDAVYVCADLPFFALSIRWFWIEENIAFFVVMGYALTPFGLWWWFHRPSAEQRAQAWPSCCTALLVAFLPFLIHGVVGLWIAFGHDMHGYIAYFGGVAMLWWGYAQLLMGETSTANTA